MKNKSQIQSKRHVWVVWGRVVGVRSVSIGWSISIWPVIRIRPVVWSVIGPIVPVSPVFVVMPTVFIALAAVIFILAAVLVTMPIIVSTSTVTLLMATFITGATVTLLVAAFITRAAAVVIFLRNT